MPLGMLLARNKRMVLRVFSLSFFLLLLRCPSRPHPTLHFLTHTRARNRLDAAAGPVAGLQCEPALGVAESMERHIRSKSGSTQPRYLMCVRLRFKSRARHVAFRMWLFDLPPLAQHARQCLMPVLQAVCCN
ncbi:hypothetical protein LX32DRAFT_459942 [Colletotrichum zoysiae]|uniref:Secreted protein n=1 Tax=Colletotrichum zoysiae TaxID=1216348 RepID=A0AAD9HDH9_9PEZI|nr:hypothetical protein LX32DRAFT_459942 [Colletotrichum zoysiae]